MYYQLSWPFSKHAKHICKTHEILVAHHANMRHWTTSFYCWPTVYDVGPTVNQRWANATCLLGKMPISFPAPHRYSVSHPQRNQTARNFVSQNTTIKTLWAAATYWDVAKNQGSKCHSVILRNTTHISLYFMFKSCASPTVYYAMAVIAITRSRFDTLWRFLHILKQLRYITLQRLCAKDKYSDEVRCVQPTRYIKPIMA